MYYPDFFINIINTINTVNVDSRTCGCSIKK